MWVRDLCARLFPRVVFIRKYQNLSKRCNLGVLDTYYSTYNMHACVCVHHQNCKYPRNWTLMHSHAFSANSPQYMGLFSKWSLASWLVPKAHSCPLSFASDGSHIEDKEQTEDLVAAGVISSEMDWFKGRTNWHIFTPWFLADTNRIKQGGPGPISMFA